MEAPILNNRYQIQKRLSKKGARQTLLAQDLTTGEPVVIKLLMFDDEFKWEDHKLFERGAGALKSLSHPGIPHYLDYFDVQQRDAQGFAQVQSYIPAKSLEEHLQAGRSFSESEIRQIAKDLLNILIYLHNRQPAVIHRDIKPSNILLSDRSGNSPGTVYLVDFDSVQVHTAANVGSTMTVVGTYGYMPPEQFGGQACPASDLYSLGATLIYITTGKHPAELPQENLQIQFEAFANLSPDLSNWLKWMTDPDLKKRLSSAELALQTLDEPTAQSGGFGKTVEAIAKPDDSKVVLRCQPESLEIIATYTLPESASALIYLGIVLCFFGAGPLFLGLMTLVGGLTTILSALTSLDVSNLIGGLVFLVFGVILVATAVVLMLPMLFCLPRQRRLYINASQVSLTRKVLFLSQTVRANRREIKQLVCKLRPQQVMLFARQQRFVIPTSSAPELEWLGQELSLWLKIPVDKL